MVITPTQIPISQLFSLPNEQFIIPAYQRRYAWGEKQIGELFDDILYLKEDDKHLLSSVLLLTEEHTANINKLEVVDGQQRITSLAILLKVLQKRFEALSREDIVDEIGKLIVCKNIKRETFPKVVLGDLDHTDFIKVLDQNDLEKVRNTNLIFAYDMFNKWLENNCNDFDKLYSFYYKLINNLLIIRLEVSKAKDAYKLFETINNRGLRLNATDIIKNFLLGHASLINEDILKKVRNYWKDLIINLDGIPADNFFRHFLAGILKRKVPNTRVIDEFKIYYYNVVKEANLLSSYFIYHSNHNHEITSEEENDDNGNSVDIINAQGEYSKFKKVSLVNFAKALCDSSAIYSKIYNRTFSNDKINRSLFNLVRIKSLPSNSFLLDLFQRDVSVKEQLSILKLIESFMLRWHICEYRTSLLDDIFPKLTTVSSEEIVLEVKKNLKQHLPPDDEFVRKFANYNFKGNDQRAKYALEEFEYQLIENQDEYILSPGSDLWLEHIIPQTIETKRSKKEFGDWVKYLGPQALKLHKEYVDRIGNYTLLADELNIVASNNPFRAKKKAYKKSNIRLTQKIINEYSRFKFREVENRSKELSLKAVKIWSL